MLSQDVWHPMNPPVSRRIAEACAILSLFTILLAFPLIRSGLPDFGTVSADRALISLFEIMFVFCIVCSGKVQVPAFLPQSWISCVALLWLLWSVLSLVLAEHFAAALVRQSEWYLHLLFTGTLWSYIRSEKMLAGNIIKAILGGFFLYCLLILYCWYNIYPDPHLHNWLTEMPGFSNIRHFGHYAMVAVILSSFPIFNSHGTKGRQFLYFAMMSCCWGALIWSGSRGPILAALFSLMLLSFFIPASIRKRLLFYQATAFAAGTYLSHFYRVDLHGLGLKYLADSMNETTVSGFSSGRTDIWMETIPAVLGHPFFGMGADGFIFIPRTTNLWIAHPHNLFLQAAIDWGLPGLLFTCVLLFAALRHFFVQLRQQEGISSERIVSIWGVTALCMLALIDGPFYHAHSLAISACLLAIALKISPEMMQPVGMAPSPSLMAFALVPLLAVLLAHLWIVSAQSKDSSPGPASLVVKLAHVLPTDISHSTRWAEKWTESSPAEAIKWLHWGHEHVRFSKKPAFIYAEAKIHIQQKRWREAKAHLQEALQLFPRPKVEERIRRDLDMIEQELSSARD